ncbi:MAG: hypothetical protein AAFX94_17510, partial [Myxococcota bacterium]
MHLSRHDLREGELGIFKGKTAESSERLYFAADVHPEVLETWATRRPFFSQPGRARIIAWLVSVAAVGATIAWPLTSLGPVPLIAVALVAAVVARVYR